MFSQTSISLNDIDTEVKDVLKKIESQAGVRFFYSENLTNLHKKVDIQAADASVDEVLEIVLDGLGLTYKVFDENLVVISSEEFNKQEIIIKGKITDIDGNPLPGVNIVEKGTTNGAVSNLDGEYSISVGSPDAILSFSYVGFLTEDIEVAGQTQVNLTLVEDIQSLDEVVVVGYITKKKRDITGSIVTVSGDDLAQSKTESFAQALQGRSAGVYVMSNSGRPGGGVSIRIRGIGGINNSEPLYIIDGVQIGGSSDNAVSNPLANINPSDIESVEVLKDASSAAIYGARGANGVVIITTKRGSSGKAKLSYNVDYGWQNITNPDNIKMLNARQFAEWSNAAYISQGDPVPFDGSSEYFPVPSELGAGTDWLEAMTVKNAPVQNHQLSVSGGNENHNVYFSLNYFDQKGILITSGYERYSIRLNTDHKLNNWLNAGNSLMVARSNRSGNDEPGSGDGALRQAFIYPPTIPIYNDDGTFAGPPTNYYAPRRNPYADWTSTERDHIGTKVLGNVYIQVEPLNGLSFKTSLSVDLGYSNNSRYTPAYDEGINTETTNRIDYSASNSSTLIWTNILTYRKSFGNHNILALAGTESFKYENDNLNSSINIDDPGIKVVQLTGAASSSLSQSLSGAALISYFGNLSYNFSQKYYIEGNIRRDGSSKFGVNNRWGVFPSGSAAWRLTNEPFFPDNLVDDLKIRVSYGEVGNDKIGTFRYIVPVSTTLYSFTGINGEFANGKHTDSRLANPNLKWETSKQTNIGLDVTLLNSRLSFAADYFKTDISDMLLPLQIPRITGASGNLTTNVGSLTNKGLEFEASFNDRVGDFRYKVHANLTTYDNKITDIGDNEFLAGNVTLTNGPAVSRTYLNGSLGDFYGYICEGIFQTQEEVDAANTIDGDDTTPYQYAGTAPGDFKWKDIDDGDGGGPNGRVSLDEDRTVIGSPIPDFTYGFGFDIGYKGFDLNALFSGVQGRDIYNALRQNLEESGNVHKNHSVIVLNAWNGEGTSNTIARSINEDPNFNGKTISSTYVEDASFLRLRNIQLSYTIPHNIVSSLKMSNARVYVTGENLLTFTKYSGYDPEIGFTGSSPSNLDAGIEMEVYPQAKSVHIGARITF